MNDAEKVSEFVVRNSKLGTYKKFDIVKMGNTFKHEFSKEERKRQEKMGKGVKSDKLKEKLPEIMSIKRETNGVVFSKPHTDPKGIHVDFVDERGHKVDKLTRHELLSTYSFSLSPSATTTLTYPEGATTHTVGIYVTPHPSTISTSITNGKLKIHANNAGTIVVAFW